MAGDDFARVSEFANTLMFETPGGQRYTTDSPILPNVWLAYAHEPKSQQKLILTLKHGEAAGRTVRKLREMLNNFRSSELGATFDGKPRERAEVSYIPGQIAAKLYFDELMRVALPLTSWWMDTDKELKRLAQRRRARNSELADADEWQHFPMGDPDGKIWKELVGGLLHMRRETPRQTSSAIDVNVEAEQEPLAQSIPQLPFDLIWLVRIAGLINAAIRDKDGKSILDTELGKSVARDFWIRGLSRRRPDQDMENGEKLTREEQQSIASKQKEEVESDRQKIVNFFLDIYSGWLASDAVGAEVRKEHDVFTGETIIRGDDRPRNALLWRITKNRDIHLAVNESAMTVKADAARRLFDISCDNITWAVIDSGIDSKHPAFKAHKTNDTTQNGTKETSRVVKTLDFTNLRTLLDPEVWQADPLIEGELSDDSEDPYERLVKCIEDRLPVLEDGSIEDPDGGTLEERDLEKIGFRPDNRREPTKRERAVAHIGKLRSRIEKGLEIDWQHLEPMVVDRNPAAPSNDHGTHVAGVLGADWRMDESVAKNDPIRDDIERMEGVCPSINLIDVRVFREDGRTDEFELIAAIQFLRWMNDRAGYMVVHGANMSLSLIHEVRRFACGQTPICIECNEAIALGMVIVAAAGNRGFEAEDLDHLTSDDGYKAISITDPGNASEVITVGATHRRRPHEYGVSYFSSRGPTGDGRMKPDLVAPGEKITAPILEGNYGSKDGTSMAAPHVSGAAAMLMARHPELIGNPRRIKQILCETATDLGRTKEFQGHGMVDVLRALQSL